jgi:hypothetical protein
VVTFSVSTYPQIFLDNPTGAVQRGLVARGPDFFLPIEFNARLGRFASTARPVTTSATMASRKPGTVECWWSQGVGAFATGYPKQTESTIGPGGRQALDKNKTLNLLLMAGRSFEPIMITNVPAELDRLCWFPAVVGAQGAGGSAGGAEAVRREQAVAADRGWGAGVH